MYINILELFYPIDSIYMSFNNTSPAEFIGGTWEKLENKVIRAGNDVLSGGEDTHTLNANEMPVHAHQLPFFPNYIEGVSYGLDAIGGAYPGYVLIGGKRDNLYKSWSDNAGQTKSHNNLPAYQNIYIWRRIS